MAVPVRPADPAIVDLLEPGMHVAVVTVGEAGEPAAAGRRRRRAGRCRSDPSAGPTERPVVLAVPAESADQLVAAALAGTIALRFT